MIPRSLLTLITCSVMVPAVALSQAPDGKTGLSGQPKGEPEQAVGGLVDGRFGFGGIDEDFFVTINVGTAITWWKLGVGIQVPLRLRVVDEDPQNDGVFREEDWDEPSDWTRVLRYVSWGQPNDDIYARLGVLAGTTLGHGTIVDRYYNVIDADHYQTGVQLHLDFGVAGGQTFLDNLLDPEILALRGYVRPFRIVDGMSKALQNIYVGTTLAIDFAAPNRVEGDSNHFDSEGKAKPVLDDDGVIQATTNTLFLWGLDIGWALQPIEWWAITPYMDINVLGATGGAGFHLGILQSFDIAKAVKIGARVEYRAMDGDYAPSYINSWYEIERFSYGKSGVPKGRVLKDISDTDAADETLHGWHASLDVTVLDAITISGIREDYEGSDNANLMLRLLLPYIAGFKLNAYYAKRNFGGIEEAFDLDQALLIAELKYKFWGPMFAYATYAREWKVIDDIASDDHGDYETINTWDAGIGVEFTF